MRIMNKFLLIAAGLLASTTVMAQSLPRGTSTYNFDNDVSTRSGTYCKLKLNGEDYYDGLCNVSRRGPVTVITTGRQKYRIVRDAFDDTEARFETLSGRLLDNVTANGSCWTGPVVRYCAK